MMSRISIRLRLAIWYSAVLLIGLALFGYAMWFVLDRRLVTGVDYRLDRQAESLRLALSDEGVATSPRQIQEEVIEAAGNGASIQLRMSNGVVISSSADQPPPEFVSDGQSYHTIQSGGRLFRVFAGQIRCGDEVFSLFMAMPLDDVRTVMRDFRNLLMMMIPGILAAACLGGWWISRRALAPVDEITMVARSITVQNLSKRLAVPNTGDELQRMSQTWNEVLARLEAAVDRTRRFTADASHELRTPVALIRSTAELALRRERDPEDYRKALRQIEAEAERMTALTNDLLSLAAADANSVEMPLAPLDLNCLANEIVQEQLARAEAKGVRIQADLLAKPGTALANYAGMRRALRILIDNALKFTESGGSVLVSTMGVPAGVTLSVWDSGPGIPAEALPHVFERFYQADPSHGENAGAGLGLSIAQMIAKAHGSEIKVESTLGTGSCFSLTLGN
jgi:heavy metal sensor kinase